MSLKFGWLLLVGLTSTAASAETYTYGFEDKAGPNQFANILNPQTISFDAATFSGGAVLKDASNFPALGNFFPGNHSTYGTSNMGTNLLSTLSIGLIPDFHANEVSFTLFNGEITTQDYIVNVFSGISLLDSVQVKKLAPNMSDPTNSHSSNVAQEGAGSYAFVDLRYADITNITITFLSKPDSSRSNPNVWDFLIDDVTFTGTGTFNEVPTTPPVPEPESYAMMMAGLGIMGFVAKRRKAA